MLSTMSLSPRPSLLPSTSPFHGFHHLKAHFGFHGPCSQNSVFITAHPNRNPRRLLAAVPKSDRSGGELPVIVEGSECCGELVPAVCNHWGSGCVRKAVCFPASYSLSLGFIVLTMGLTLELKDLIGLFLQRPLSVSFFIAFWALFAGAGCCSTNTCWFLSAKCISSISLNWLHHMLLCLLYWLLHSLQAENVVRFRSSVVGDSGGLLGGAQGSLFGDWGPVLLSVVLLHFSGFFVGYLAAAFARFKEPQRRAISIEVGMQNSSLGVVLATSHFTSPLFALAPAMSAVITNIMGSNQGFLWRYVDPSHGKKEPESDTK